MTTRTYRTRHTKADVERALKDMERLYAPTERARAEARLRRAKGLMTAAAQAVLDRGPDAAELGNRALAELKAAQAELEKGGKP